MVRSAIFSIENTAYGSIAVTYVEWAANTAVVVDWMRIDGPEAARSFFDTASSLRPAQANAYYGLAVASEGLGDLAQARTAMKAYLHVADGNDPYRRKAESAIWEWEAALAAQNDEQEKDN